MAAIRPNPTLSEDLISEILKRVPVKSLLCCQSVCKNWLSLIKHPAFIKSQLLHAVKTLTDQTFIITGGEQNFSLLSTDSRQIVADLKLPYSRGEYKNACARLVGSANGIVCVVADDNMYQHKPSIYLWNPAIRRSKLIPLDSMRRALIDFGLGFGYDEIEQDFKVVRVFKSESGNCAEVYSENGNAWRKVPDPIAVPSRYYFDVCVNGFLCGMGEKHSMMAFDLNKEVLNCAIMIPLFSYADDVRIIEYNNSVAFIIVSSKWNNTKMTNEWKINLWTLDDDACLRGGGVEASWTPMFSVDIDGPIDIIVPGQIILGYISNGDLVLLLDYDYRWISCNADKKEAKILSPSVDINQNHFPYDFYKYTESLVSLSGFKQVNWNDGEDDN